MSSYRQALKTARTEYIRKLIDNHQNNPRFLFSTVARLTNKQMSPDLNIPSQFNSNDFMNFFTDKIDNIRNTITNVDSTASSISASFIAPKEKLQCFTTIGQDELNKLITASKPSTCLLDPVPTKLLKELLPVAEQPLLNIINSSLSLGHVPKPFKLAVIKPLIHKHSQDPLSTVNIITFSSLLLYVQYHEQPVCTSLLFTLLFIKSQYTVFLFSFFVHLIVFLHILLFFCTSHCLLHILLFFAHLIVLHFFISLHILFLFLLFLPYVCPCVMLLI